MSTLSTPIETGSDSKHPSIKEIFRNTYFQRILIYAISHALIGVMPNIIMPAFGGRYFSDCDEDTNDDDCEYNYTQYNFWNSLFLSIRGLTGFLFGGFVGSISDKLGRKPFLLAATALWLLTFAIMSFYANIWIYWVLSTLIYGLFGNSQVLSYIESAYISDIISLEQKTIGFTLALGTMSLALLIGSGLAPLITAIWELNAIFLLLAIMYLLVTLFVIFCLKESLYVNKSAETPVSNSSSEVFRVCRYNWNIFKPLFYVNSNRVILCMSMIGMLAGIVVNSYATVAVYLNDQLRISDDTESTLITLSMYGTMSTTASIVSIIIVPVLKSKCSSFATDINLLIIGITWLMLYALIMSIIAFITDDDGDSQEMIEYCLPIIIVASIFTGGLGWFVPALSGIISTYINEREHGLAFGIVQSYTSALGIIGPFAIGYGYNESKDKLNFPSLILYIVALLLFIALMIAIGPLRTTIKDLDERNERLSIIQHMNDNTELLRDQSQGSVVKQTDTYTTFETEII